ncbi:MAG: hypothetical protein U1E02_38610, partial [Hydrogenophaga sp.]|nr:hypothetical protein [Hydrogenophaga sp.]
SIESKAEIVSSKIDTIVPALTPELWSIESKAEVISSKIDTLHMQATATTDLTTVYSKLDSIINENWSIESKAEIISSKIDTIIPAITPELWSIESKAEVISSKIDNLHMQVTATTDLTTVYSKLDSIINEDWSIESKAEIISSKIDTIIPAITPELWSIESKAEVISSKIDTLPSQITPELWSIESKTEVISSKIDLLLPENTCSPTPITPTEDITLGMPSTNYCLTQDTGSLEAPVTITIDAPNISLTLNNRELIGRIIITPDSTDVIVEQGVVHAPGPTDDNDAINGAIEIQNGADRAHLQNLTILCETPSSRNDNQNGITGRSGINNQAN